MSGRSSTLPIEPTMVTSSPSSTQATPSASTMRQCQRDQGSRSSRAGMSLWVTGRVSVAQNFAFVVHVQAPYIPLSFRLVDSPHARSSFEKRVILCTLGEHHMATNTVRLHRVLRAPPERLYRAFLDPDA